MSEPIKCFFLEPTKESRRYLRRYVSGSKCDACEHGYHQAWVHIGDHPTIETAEGYESSPDLSQYAADPRWPKQAACGYEFSDEDSRQVFVDRLYRRTDNDELLTLRDRVPGAMWDATWYEHRKGPDGRTLFVVCPDGHEWCIDDRASNCTMPGDDEHRCWVRHGEPPEITVDKNGNTCGAGAGSIQTPKWHGFLRGGFLVT